MSEHKYSYGQRLVIVNEPTGILEGQQVEVAALLDNWCATHGALSYGCIMNGDHIAICEEQLASLSDKQKRKLN